jgi:hypothetical protein
VRLVNQHVCFYFEDSDLSEFGDYLAAIGEDPEQKALQKVRRRHKKKLIGGGKPLPMETPNFIQMSKMIKGGKGISKRNVKHRSNSNSINEGVVSGDKGVEEERRTEGVPVEDEVSYNVIASSTSGLRLILEDGGSFVPETPILVQSEDPLKKLEALSLFGIQNVMGFSFATHGLENTERLEVMEVVDVKNKVIRESRKGDQ